MMPWVANAVALIAARHYIFSKSSAVFLWNHALNLESDLASATKGSRVRKRVCTSGVFSCPHAVWNFDRVGGLLCYKVQISFLDRMW